MTSILKTSTKVLLLAVAVTGLVFASLATTAHDQDDDPNLKPVDAHAISRTFPDLTSGVRTVVCSETVATVLEITGSGPKADPNQDCDEDNPNWLIALNTGGATASDVYYDLARLRVHSPGCDLQTHHILPVNDPKAGFRCETDISQSTLLGFGNPNNWYASSKEGDVTWRMALCDNPQFRNIDPIIPGVLEFSDAIIECQDNGGWSVGTLATDTLVNFGTNTVSTGFFRPTIEEVYREANASGNHYLGSCVTINKVNEVKLGAANVQHTEGVDSLIDSHDWFYVIDGALPTLPLVLYDLAGSDTQDNDRHAGSGLCDGGRP